MYKVLPSLADAVTQVSVTFSGTKAIVVFGATGLQGGSVVRAMKGDKRFVVKAATRNTESESAKKLAAEGHKLSISVNVVINKVCTHD